MKIKDFLRENQLSVGDNVSLLLEKLGFDKDRILKKLESEIGEVAKMSKSKGNTVDPEEAIELYGADTVRLYILFAAPPEQDFEWTEEGIQGAHRFLKRLWNFVSEKAPELRSVPYSREDFKDLPKREKELRRAIHETLRDYLKDMEKEYQFNTAIAKIMKLFNELSDYQPRGEQGLKVLKEGLEILLFMLSPITPHICDELWERLGNEEPLIKHPFPQIDESALEREEVEIPVQINGKVRTRIKIPFGADEETVRNIALKDSKVKNYLDGKEIKKFIYIKNKLVNIVIG
ncbi:MAG: class I tRNA ligase family protein [Aquificae bacterium]|nr:class I tRNA ligase family protein [Aquificota bacterium]